FFVRSDRRLDLLFDSCQVERRRPLHRWEFDGSLAELEDDILDQNEPPGFTAHEVVEVGRRAFSVVQDRRTLERILPKVVDQRHVDRDLRAGPALRLLIKLVLEVIDSYGSELRASEIEELVADRGAFALEQRHLIVAVEMILVGPVAELRALEKFFVDVRIARGGDERRIPVEPGEQSVLDRARLDVARPADDAGH